MNAFDSRGGFIEELEGYASALEASGEYRILRRLRLRKAASPPDAASTRRAVFVDTETTGLDPESDEVLELAMLAFDYRIDGTFASPAGSFDRLRDPGRPIPAEVSALTGITDEMVCGKHIDPVEVAAFVEGAALVIAHNSAFDRRFCERLFPVFAQKPWACSLHEVDWKAEGFESSRLSQLANGDGFFFDGHRALNDCEAALELLSRPLPRSGRTVLSALLESARRPRWRIRALGAPYALRDVLKRRGYRWEPGVATTRGAWWSEVAEEAFETECDFLRTEIYRRNDAVIDARLLTAFERYSDRSEF
ncbi:3'-5' exonuclease [Bradyrhizobium genosp. P]|uniref:3'-5' exonuclease n=1 Tax=Bradyrhizobium genosp. P TaxID=83641 RepID=UPI003CF3D724